MSPEPDKLTEFLRLIEPWVNSYSRANISYIAAKASVGPCLILGRMLLGGGHSPVNYKQFYHDSEQIFCGNCEVEFSEKWLRSLLDGLRGGDITLDNRSYRFAIDPGSSVHFTLNKTGALGIASPFRIPGIQITGGDLRKVGFNADFDRLNWDIRSASPPFGDFGELLDLMEIRRDVLSISSPTFDIVGLPPGLITQDSSMSKGKLKVRLRAGAKSKRRDFSVSYKIATNKDIKAGEIPHDKIRWKRRGDGVDGTASASVGDGHQAHLFLKYHGEAIQHWWVRDAARYINPFMVTYECFDGGSEVLSKFLFKPRHDAIGFEVGVALLLNTLGIATSHYGIQENIQDGPDIVAVGPGMNAFLVIECTTDLLDKNDKLGKLIKRTQALREKMADTDFSGIPILAVIVSALPRAHLSAHFSTARDHEVAVVAKEELKRWFDMRVNGLNPQAVINELTRLIPPSQPQPHQIMPVGFD